MTIANMTSTDWSVEQETMLFKSICRVKPVGPHKHFRMLTIHSMVNSGDDDKTKTIGIKQIWDKLESLYDLKGLDDIDNTQLIINESGDGELDEQTAESPTDASGSEDTEDQFQDFELPLDDWILLVESKAQEKSSNESKQVEEDEEIESDGIEEKQEEIIQETKPVKNEETTNRSERKRGRSASVEIASDSENEVKPRKTRSSARVGSAKPNKKEETKKDNNDTKKEIKKIKEETKKSSIEDQSDIEDARSSRRISRIKPSTGRKESPAPANTPRRSSRRK